MFLFSLLMPNRHLFWANAFFEITSKAICGLFPEIWCPTLTRENTRAGSTNLKISKRLFFLAGGWPPLSLSHPVTDKMDPLLLFSAIRCWNWWMEISHLSLSNKFIDSTSLFTVYFLINWFVMLLLFQSLHISQTTVHLFKLRSKIRLGTFSAIHLLHYPLTAIDTLLFTD